MSVFLEYLRDNTQREPDREVLFDDIHTTGISYGELDKLSGKVYAWVKEQGLGKEDFVLINLPRSVLPVIAMIGIWKAGAVWVLVEDKYARNESRLYGMIAAVRRRSTMITGSRSCASPHCRALNPRTAMMRPSQYILLAALESPRVFCMSGAAWIINAEGFARM